MSVYDTSYAPADSLPWRAEVAARLEDFLARKARSSSRALATRLSRFVARLDGAVPAVRLKSAVRDLLHALRRSDAEAVDVALRELEERVRRYRQSESIENYSAYLFTVDCRL